MAATKLRSSTISLICRTCLKLKKEHRNIFEFSLNNKFMSDLLMECVPIKIEKDGFPVNICGSCIKRLSSVYDFKEMVIEADRRLRNFYQTDNIDSVKMQENLISIKSKELQAVSESVSSSFPSKSGKPDDIPAFSQDVSDPLSLQSIIKWDSLDVYRCNNNEEDIQFSDQPENFDGINSISDISIDESLEIHNLTEPEENKVSVEQIQATDSKIENEDELTTIGSQSECEMKLPSDDNNVTKQRGHLTKDKRKDSDRNVNEKQVELLGNEDYKRIMQMGLSKKEKSILPVFCPDCNRTFTFRYFVGIHAHFHTGNLPFKCDKCDLRFPKKTTLTQHLIKHMKAKNFACEVCGKTFSRLGSVKSHKTVHVSARLYKCDICSKTYKHMYTMQKHRRTHSSPSKHICEICGKIFANMECLRNHRMRHTVGDRKFSCKICDKKFSYKKDLQAHSRRHSKTHVCEHCGRSFYDSSLLQQHIWIHTGEKPFACKICGKRFRQRACIGRHMRTHTGETPFPCKLCSSRFKYSHHLLNHMKVHHKEETS